MIARKSFVVLIMQMTGAILGYIALFFVVKYMGPEPLGIVGFALSFAMIFSIIIKLGFDSAHIKRISEGKDLGECIGTYMLIKATLSMIYVAVILLAIYVWTVVLGRGFESIEHKLAIYVMTFYCASTSMEQVMHITFLARKEIAKHQIVFLINTIVRSGATIIVAISRQGALALAFTYIVGEIAMLIASGILFSKYPIHRPRLNMIKSYGVFALPVVIINSIDTIMNNIDKVFIQLFWGAREVGYYYAVYRLIMFLLMINTSVGMILFPTFSELQSKQKKNEITNVIHRSERYLVLIIAPIVFLIAALSRPIIHILFSDSFYPAEYVMIILPFWALTSALALPYTNLMLGINKPWVVTMRSIILVFANIILNLIFIPIDIKILGWKGLGLGATGAAIATVITATSACIYIRVAAWYYTKIKQNIRVVIPIIVAFITGVILRTMTIYFPVERWYQLLAFALFGLVLYIGMLYILKEFRKEDYRFFMDTLNPVKTLKYIKSELTNMNKK